MDALFGPRTNDVDEHVFCAIEAGHVQLSGVITGATDSHVSCLDDPSEDNVPLTMTEIVGYVDSDDLPINCKHLTAEAL